MDPDVLARIDRVPGWMDRDELTYLYGVAKGKRILEVGVYQGRSTLAFLLGSAHSVVGVDDWRWATQTHASAHLHGFTNLRLLPVDTADPSLPKQIVEASLSLDGDGEFDYIFLDGSHDEDSITHDITLAKALSTGKTVLGGHDYADYWPSVIEVVDRVFGKAVGRPAGTIWEVRYPLSKESPCH